MLLDLYVSLSLRNKVTKINEGIVLKKILSVYSSLLYYTRFNWSMHI